VCYIQVGVAVECRFMLETVDPETVVELEGALASAADRAALYRLAAHLPKATVGVPSSHTQICLRLRALSSSSSHSLHQTIQPTRMPFAFSACRGCCLEYTAWPPR
jgi:hypothetical protein